MRQYKAIHNSAEKHLSFDPLKIRESNFCEHRLFITSIATFDVLPDFMFHTNLPFKITAFVADHHFRFAGLIKIDSDDRLF
jgi:hypothetical protein